MLIRPGDRSEQVVDVQARLRALGLAVDDDPGNFGAGTGQAVRAFQQRRGIRADGLVGPHTWAELVEAGWRLGDRVLYLKHPPFRGDDVLALQARLNALGFDAGREDGIFGVDTDGAVRSFQREYGVAEDGIAGPHSYLALAGLRINRALTAAALREELERAAVGGIQGALVAIDPGHGGDDLGGIGPCGTNEADVCWDLASRLAGRLAGTGARVRFTRTETEGPDASGRAQRANEMDAHLFVSLHLNSNDEPAAEGVSTYFFRTSRAGEQLAELIQTEVGGLGLRDCRAHPSSYPELRETRMPAVIVEPGYITNPDEEKRFDEPEFRNRVAGALARAIRRFYELG